MHELQASVLRHPRLLLRCSSALTLKQQARVEVHDINVLLLIYNLHSYCRS